MQNTSKNFTTLFFFICLCSCISVFCFDPFALCVGSNSISPTGSISQDTANLVGSFEGMSLTSVFDTQNFLSSFLKLQTEALEAPMTKEQGEQLIKQGDEVIKLLNQFINEKQKSTTVSSVTKTLILDSIRAFITIMSEPR